MDTGFSAYTVCEQWEFGPMYDYGAIHATDAATFAAQLAAHFAECDRQRRGIAYVRIHTRATGADEQLTRAEVEARYL